VEPGSGYLVVPPVPPDNLHHMPGSLLLASMQQLLFCFLALQISLLPEPYREILQVGVSACSCQQSSFCAVADCAAVAGLTCKGMETGGLAVVMIGM